jgi:hypothetical protein
MQPARAHAPNSVEIGGFQLKTDDDEIHPVRQQSIKILEIL